MYGNRLGWGISAAIVMVVVWLAYLLQGSQQISPPTDWVKTAASGTSTLLMYGAAVEPMIWG